MSDITALLDIFQRARSSWGDTGAAIAEIDGIIVQLQRGEMPDQLTMRVLFTVTGPMQELSLSSGWGNRFLQLASEFDDAMSAGN